MLDHARGKISINAHLFVRPFLIRPPVSILAAWRRPIGGTRIVHVRQHRRGSVEVGADSAAPSISMLEDGGDARPAHGRVDELATLGANIADLDAARGIDGNCLRVGGVLGFRPKLDRFPWLAHRYLEAPRRTGLVGMVGADDGEGDVAHLQL